MKKIKILRIIARLNIGGPAIHTILLTEGLDKSRFDTLLICGSTSKDEGNMLYYAIEKNVRPHIIPELRRKLSLLNDILAFKKIYQLIKLEQPDIIHTHTAKAGALGRLAGLLYNFFRPFAKRHIKLVHTFHGHVFEGYFNRFETAIFIFIERFLALFTCKIVTVSNSVKDAFIGLGITDKNKIEVIPLGFELDKFLDIPPRNGTALNIGIVGRLAPIKNHRLFLEAAAKFRENNPQMQLRFKIIGDGELRKELQDYARNLNIDKQVDFLGWQKDLAGVYSDLDIVVLTSINEGTPVSIIEAMAAGRAIVATDVGGIRDLLGKEINIEIEPDADFRVLERGIIVRPHDSLSFAQALHLLLKSKELRRSLGEAGRNFVRFKFTKDRLIEDIENLYIMI